MPSHDIPQARHLGLVRAITELVAAGASQELIAGETGLSARHVNYHLQAAEALGWLEGRGKDRHVTDRGRAVLSTPAGTPAEIALIEDGIRSNPTLAQVADEVIDGNSNSEQLAEKLVAISPISQSTARSRAAALIRWREYLNPAPAAQTVSTPPGEILSKDDLSYVRRQVAEARFILLTGSDFSSAALDRRGRPIPSIAGLREDLWALCYPDERLDKSATTDELLERARRTDPNGLRRVCQERLRVASDSLPSFYRDWFSMPWRRVYTVRLDTLEEAANEAFDLPRRLMAVSAPSGLATVDPPSDRSVQIVHLAGHVSDDGAWSASLGDFASHVAAKRPWYAQLSADLLAFPFVFAGSPPDDPLFWHHILLRGRKPGRGTPEHRPRSFLVTPVLSRPKQDLLAEYNVRWVPASPQEFSQEVLAGSASSVQRGMARLHELAQLASDSVRNVEDVASLVAGASTAPTEYLLGSEPTWGDVVTGRAISRDADANLLETAQTVIEAEDGPSVIVVGGTAGSGKSTALMRLCIRLNSAGSRVLWIPADAEVSPGTIKELLDSEHRPGIVAIDDADRYGRVLREFTRPAANEERRTVWLLAMRSSKLDLVDHTAHPPLIHIMPPLTDEDVDALLDTLTRERRLGRLRGKPRAEQQRLLRERAGRQLLVAMIEATSGVRFEEKIVSEWHDLPDRSRRAYVAIAVATVFRSYLTRDEALLAMDARTAEEVAALELLSRRHIVATFGVEPRLRARHRVVAEKLLDELSSRGSDLLVAYRGLARTFASRVREDMSRSARPWRLLKQLINHSRLLRLFDVDDARSIYDEVEALLEWDYHYFLQRGSLEVESGSVRLAENMLNQAMGLNDTDPYVRTEYAYMLMRKACSNPRAVDAQEWFDSGVEMLRQQIAVRGREDSYPFHVLGSQGLSWSRKAELGVAARKQLLGELVQFAKESVRLHPRQAALRQLLDDIRREWLKLNVAGAS